IFSMFWPRSSSQCFGDNFFFLSTPFIELPFSLLCRVRPNLRQKSSNGMAFTLPQPRNGNYRKGDISNNGGVIWEFPKRAIDIADYRYAKDKVNPATNRTFGSLTHRLIPSH